MLRVPDVIVSVDWLKKNKENDNLIILDATIPKVVQSDKDLRQEFIPNSLFFDLRNKFSDVESNLPNTVPNSEQFQENARELGINNDSCVVVYDQHGVYSSPRAWWLFRLMGFENVAVLDGGLPAWKKSHSIVVEPQKVEKSGNFSAKYQPDFITSKEEVFSLLQNKKYQIADARTEDRFYGKVKEPREGVRSGHIPNSVNIPFSIVLDKESKLKTKEELNEIFSEEKSNYIFSCGSGITASVLALSYVYSKNMNFAIYDGSWTEWGSNHNLPIEV